MSWMLLFSTPSYKLVCLADFLRHFAMTVLETKLLGCSECGMSIIDPVSLSFFNSFLYVLCITGFLLQ